MNTNTQALREVLETAAIYTGWMTQADAKIINDALKSLRASHPPAPEASGGFSLVRSIIHECPALKWPQSLVEKLGMAANIIPLKGATEEQAQIILNALNAAPEAAKPEHCPYCPDQGWYSVANRNTGEEEQEQCEFCETVPNSVFNLRRKAGQPEQQAQAGEPWPNITKISDTLSAVTVGDCLAYGDARAAAAIAKKDAALKAQNEALRIFVSCKYPVSKQIDERGYRWSEAYLDQALPIAKAAITQAEGARK